MTRPMPYPSRLFTAPVTASWVTVLPIATDGLIVVEQTPVHGPRCAFPTADKRHLRVRPDTAALQLLLRDLGTSCDVTDLRLVAVLDPEPGHPREAVYTACVRWPDHRPAQAACGRHRLLAVATREQATRAGLGPARIVDLLTGPDLLAAATALPELVTLDGPTPAAATNQHKEAAVNQTPAPSKPRPRAPSRGS